MSSCTQDIAWSATPGNYKPLLWQEQLPGASRECRASQDVSWSCARYDVKLSTLKKYRFEALQLIFYSILIFYHRWWLFPGFMSCTQGKGLWSRWWSWKAWQWCHPATPYSVIKHKKGSPSWQVKMELGSKEKNLTELERSLRTIIPLTLHLVIIVI